MSLVPLLHCCIFGFDSRLLGEMTGSHRLFALCMHPNSSQLSGAPCLLSSIMASTLCVKARQDLYVAPDMVDPLSVVHESQPDIQVRHLVKLMRATCLDVAESGTNSDIELANSTIFVARAIKLSGAGNDAGNEQPEAEGLPADLAHMTRGKVVQYKDNPFVDVIKSWSQDCTLVSK